MKKIRIIVVTSILIILSSLFVSYFPSFAGDAHADAMGSLLSDNGWMNKESGASGKVENLLGTIILVIKIIAVAVAIIMLLIISMKYMTSAPGEKAEIKKSAVVYVVGAVILFAVSGILTILEGLAKAINS